MLFNLSIENVALIERADVDFSDGFTVLTGETGAGKSILIGSLNMLLGERIGRGLIRNGENYAYVEGLFYLSEEVAKQLEQYDVFPDEEGSLIVSRKLFADGRNICKAGRKTISVSTLRDIGRLLINIHGQHDNQALLDSSSHLSFLDAFVPEHKDSFLEYQAIYQELKETEAKLASISTDEAENARKADILQFEIDEIKAAGLYAGEEEELKQQRDFIKNKEKFIENCGASLDLLYENEEGICVHNFLADIKKRIDVVADADSELGEIAEKVADIQYCVEDIVSTLRDRLDRISEQAISLDEIEERLDVIYRLKRKYGNTEEEILQYCEKAEEELDTIETSDIRKAELEVAIKTLTRKAQKKAEENHTIRQNAAKEIEKLVHAQLQELQMEGAVFAVHFEPCELGKNGLDKVEFLLSANMGEPLKPLTKIVSGGELSRIMLALKYVLTAGDIVSVLIFDEIDIGISGRVASKVGIKLREISKQKQVLCVTHLPQIAALSDSHYKISKQQDAESTVTNIKLLNAEEKKAEIAFMIGGDSVTEITLAQAEDMIEKGKK